MGIFTTLGQSIGCGESALKLIISVVIGEWFLIFKWPESETISEAKYFLGIIDFVGFFHSNYRFFSTLLFHYFDLESFNYQFLSNISAYPIGFFYRKFLHKNPNVTKNQAHLFFAACGILIW